MQRNMAISLSILLVATGLMAASAIRVSGDGSTAETRGPSPDIYPSSVNAPPYPDAATEQTPRTARPTSARVVVDSDGYTIYRYDRGPESVAKQRTDPRVDPWPERRLLRCDGGSPAGWPPVAYSRNTGLHDVDRRLLGTVERADGTLQLTIGGCPIYRYVGDRKPGQINGHGIDGVWFAVTPAGTNATTSYCRDNGLSGE
jgi:predicted lipoprotein with Yx(FWY)xxD motif